MAICLSLAELLEAMLFEVASFRAVTDEYVHRKPVGWLFSQYEAVQRTQWAAWREQVTAVEVGVNRALAVALSGKKKVKLPPLPTWSEVRDKTKGAQQQQRRQRPAWMEKFEEINRDRMVDGAER